MKPIVIAACLTIASALCIAEPVSAQPMPGAVYVAPAYPMPGPGYVWMNHQQYGWGWHHPQYGWHKGWDYVERPVYPIPGPGYVWMSHPRYGWGWHHPEHGWHRGWR